MRCALGRRYWLPAAALVVGCGGEAGNDLFAGSAGARAAGGSGTTGGVGVTGGASTRGGGTTGGAAGTTGGSGGTSLGTGGSAGVGGAGGKGGASNGDGGAGPSAGAGGKASGGGPGAGAAGKGSGGTPFGGAAGAGGQVTCDELAANLPKLLSAAQSCNISLDRASCTGFVKNQCDCPVPVDLPNSSAAQIYLSAVAQIMKCNFGCPEILCREATSARCQTEGSQAMGQCVAN